MTLPFALAGGASALRSWGYCSTRLAGHGQTGAAGGTAVGSWGRCRCPLPA